MNNPNEIKALVNLLDDPDDFIFEDVRSKLLVLGTEVIPYLEDFWKNNNLDEIAFNKVDFLIKEINFNVIFKELKSWEDAANQDLFEGVLIINKYQNPSVDKDLIINLLNKIKQDIWLEISNNLTSFEKINIYRMICSKINP